MHIMLIDDDDSTNFLNSTIVKRSGLAQQVSTFQGAQQALDFLQSCPQHELPELILLDINMPIMNGWDFLDAFEALALSNMPRVVMLTSSINPDDEQKASGFSSVVGYRSKPLSTEMLENFESLI
ncbi:MAG: response regulator [Cyclobacteriaceae bacterium]